MRTTMHQAAILGSAILAVAAPIDNEKRQFGSVGGGASGSPSFGGGDLPFSLSSGREGGSPSGIMRPGASIPTGGSGSGFPFSLPADGQGGLPTGLPFSLPADGQRGLPTGFPSGGEGGLGDGSFPIPSGLAGLQGSDSPLATLGGGSSLGSGSSPLAGLGSSSGDSPLAGLRSGAGLSGSGLGLEGTNFPSTTLKARQAENCDEGADAPSSPSSPASPASPVETVSEAATPSASSYSHSSSSGADSGLLIPSGSGDLGLLGGIDSSSGGISGLGGLSGPSGLGGLSGASGLGGLLGSSGLGGLSGSSGLGGLSGSSGLGGLSGSSGLGGLLGGSSGSGTSLGGLGSATGASSAEPSAPASTSAPSGTGSGSSSGGGYSDAPASSYSGGGTASDVSDNTGCRAMTFIFARGTGELGNMGSVVGPPTASALQELLGPNGVSVQGVDYPADAAGNANLGGSGGPTMADLAQQALSACPGTKIVLGGYSQGAIVVHNALSTLDGSQVAAVVAFGDPSNGQAFDGVDDSKVLEVCGSSDFLCSSGGTNVSGGHISYSDDGAQAAQFAVQAAGL